MMAQRAVMNSPRFAGNPRGPLADAGTPRQGRLEARPDGKWRGYSQKLAACATPQMPRYFKPLDEPDGLGQAARARSCSVSQISIAPATATTGNITMLTKYQPKWASIEPEMKEPTAMLPKMRKSLNACTLLRSSGR